LKPDVFRERQAKLRAYLFDFGSAEHVGTTDIGGTRFFTPVLAKESSDAGRGYGFQPRPAMQDDDQAWRGDPLERDSCRLGQGIQFGVKAVPGKYHLRVCVEPFGSGGTLILKGAAGGELRVQVPREGPPVEMDVELTGEPLTVEMDGYANLRWISLVEQTAP
jgi:hypothetical protein